MPRAAYLEHLAQVPLFRSLSKRDLQRVARAADELQVEPGRVLMEQGQVGRECFVIVDGTATVRRNGRRVATLGPGDAAGELSLLDHGPRTATVVADGAMTVLVIGAREFSGLLDEVPTVARKLLTSLAARVRELDAKAFA
ncbi:MAG TPA: cyclic nucleotide-binding domain-containing protein [Acidimicrobiales bacterium]